MITQEGTMNGHKFTVKPKSVKARKIDKQLREELKEWQEKNNPKWLAFAKKHETALAEGKPIKEEFPEIKEWIEDEEFRAKRFKLMADNSMSFDDEPPVSLWKSEELEYGIIEVAWDFFTGVRQIPNDMYLR